ncbi:hypothetical protein PInf_022373 [Phytophthora infestans]|nr:hypothetical protein PInf_022373 [Phytophthora infestans]
MESGSAGRHGRLDGPTPHSVRAETNVLQWEDGPGPEDREIGTGVRWNESGVRESVSGYGVDDSVSETEEWGCTNAIGGMVALGYENGSGLADGVAVGYENGNGLAVGVGYEIANAVPSGRICSECGIGAGVVHETNQVSWHAGESARAEVEREPVGPGPERFVYFAAGRQPWLPLWPSG